MSKKIEILIKDEKRIEIIRSRIKDFYIDGLKKIHDYKGDDRSNRRIKAIISNLTFNLVQKNKGKVFISLDTKNCLENPFFNVWKIKKCSFNDIFYLFFVLSMFPNKEEISFADIFGKIPMKDDSSDVLRAHLDEYVSLGLLKIRKAGNSYLYSINDDNDIRDILLESNAIEALHFSSEIFPCGLINFFTYENLSGLYRNPLIHFKHHFLASVLDSGVMLNLLIAINERKTVKIIKENDKCFSVIPLKILCRTQTGDNYLAGVNLHGKKIQTWKLSQINEVIINQESINTGQYQEKLSEILNHTWDVNLSESAQYDHVEFDISYSKETKYVRKRLIREKKHGGVIDIDKSHCHFKIDVCDSNEMIPWIRSFIANIENLKISNETVMSKFISDFTELATLYGVEN